MGTPANLAGCWTLRCPCCSVTAISKRTQRSGSSCRARGRKPWALSSTAQEPELVGSRSLGFTQEPKLRYQTWKELLILGPSRLPVNASAYCLSLRDKNSLAETCNREPAPARSLGHNHRRDSGGLGRQLKTCSCRRLYFVAAKCAHCLNLPWWSMARPGL